MLASPPKGERLEILRGTHAFDLKLDGIRALVYSENGVVRIMNRSGIDITHRFPEVEAAAGVFRRPSVLDGEIVALSGSFQDTAKRDKQNKPGDVASAMQALPVAFVAFDIPWLGAVDMRPHPFRHRRELLDGWWMDHDLTANPTLRTSVLSYDPAYFDQVKAAGMEGVIAKRLNSTYKAGRFSDWLKFKAVRSITAVGIGYEAGTGARAHFGAMFLALIGPDGPVEIGRVGTGFTATEITSLKTEMDAGRPVVVEIECLNKSKDGKLRFPVYKGLRTDQSVADATLAQLDEIPEM